MTLLKQIQNKLAHRDLGKVVEALGYSPSHEDQVTDVLQDLLRTRHIDSYLRQSHFDFKYTAKGLLKALCELLHIPMSAYTEAVEAFEEKQRRLSAMKQPYIFIYTGFRRRGEPIFALAAMEHKRRIKLDKTPYLHKTKEEIEADVRNVIREHYNHTGGKLPQWGEIKAYVYHDTEGNETVYSPEGERLGEKLAEERASVKLGNHTLMGV